VFELKPDAYLWQAGIAKFYLGDVEGAADIFARSADYYERKFYSPASEERIWRDACELKLASSMDNKKKKYERENGGISSVIAQVPERGEDAEPLTAETRWVRHVSLLLLTGFVRRHFLTIMLLPFVIAEKYFE
jgi:hypothetical protein